MKRLWLLFGLLALPAAAEPPDAAMVAALGVQIEKPAGDGAHFSQGSGVYLGDGLVLTAAHVITVNPADATATVVMDGWRNEARLVASGAPGLDLALLRIAPETLSLQRRSLKPVEACASGTSPNQPVVVASLGTVSLSKTIGAPIQSNSLNGDWSTILATGYGHGASGGGLFDAQKGCLAGIIIIEATGAAIQLTEFVPAAKIGMFLALHRPAAAH